MTAGDAITPLTTAVEEPARAGAWRETPEMVLAPKTTAELWSAIGAVTFRPHLDTRWVFRGLPNSTFRNISSLARRYRDHFGDLPTEDDLVCEEDKLYELARDWSPTINPLGVTDKTQVMALMQHHGVPTRLLDVTRSPLTGLWFAAARQRSNTPPCENCTYCDKHTYEQNSHDDADGIMLAIRVSGLQEVTTNHPMLPAEPDPDSKRRLIMPVGEPTIANWRRNLDRSARLGRPFLVRPSNPDARMISQEGLFLAGAAPSTDVDSSDLPPLGSNLPFDCFPAPLQYESVVDFLNPNNRGYHIDARRVKGWDVVPIIIRRELKEDLRAVLRATFNRTSSTIYPDLAGMAMMLGEQPLRGDPSDPYYDDPGDPELQEPAEQDQPISGDGR